MTRLDKKRDRDAEPPVDKDDFITIAREEERRLLNFEAKMRGASRARYLHKRQQPSDLKDRLGPQLAARRPNTRTCHHCQQVGYIPRASPQRSKDDASCAVKATILGAKLDPMVAHKTDRLY